MLINFNPRSRVGNDVVHVQRSVVHYYFNPRSRVGNDIQGFAKYIKISISIHVPAWGTTEKNRLTQHLDMIFQSTFPRGERPLHDRAYLLLRNFNPRSRVGND